ncbi:nucleoporin seh1 [Culicoides brevitarsis]|uniref:nucleoporin seh1 n=1 Tax=Culicoides brevitarsis TaxID=469753 RepID=UPI00307B207C
MFETTTIHTDHKDLIHDVQYDYYGIRFATCSSDQTVKIFDKQDNGEWVCTANWRSHSGSVWRLSWAHPEFGQVLATCSFDRTVSVWEESLAEKSTQTLTPPTRRWVRKTNLVDSRVNVTDCKFGPKHLGLMIATSSADGFIRIYEAPEITNLSQWTLQHEIDCKMTLSCISWNNSLYRLHAPMIAAGSDSNVAGGTGKVFIFEYSENARRWAKTETINAVTDEVHDLAFAPSLGRSYHTLAVGSKDLHIFNLKPILDTSSPNRLDIQPAQQVAETQVVPDRGVEPRVWRVSWNVTGTMLAATCDDGFVRLWKQNYLKSWRCVCMFAPQSQANLFQEQLPPGANDKPNNSRTTQYFKRGTITHPNQVPWH